MRCFVRKTKITLPLFLFGRDPHPRTTLPFEWYFWSKVYKLESACGQCSARLFIQKNIVVKNWCLLVSILTHGQQLAPPPLRWEKPNSVVEWWGLERRCARRSSVCSLEHLRLLSIPCFSPHQKHGQMLTAKHLPSLKLHFRRIMFVYSMHHFEKPTKGRKINYSKILRHFICIHIYNLSFFLYDCNLSVILLCVIHKILLYFIYFLQ